MSSSGPMHLRLRRLKEVYRNSIVLNPTENIPLFWEDMVEFSYVQGMYVTDKFRDDIESLDPKVIFGGRIPHIKDTRDIQDAWASLLRAEHVSLRVLSGLHAYVAVFMSLGEIGDKILVLPEVAGGHFSVKDILARLGYVVLEMPSCNERMAVDIEATNVLIAKENPRFILVDRSEGLIFEDFSGLDTSNAEVAIFDCS